MGIPNISYPSVLVTIIVIGKPHPTYKKNRTPIPLDGFENDIREYHNVRSFLQTPNLSFYEGGERPWVEGQTSHIYSLDLFLQKERNHIGLFHPPLHRN